MLYSLALARQAPGKANLLSDLYRLDATLTAALEWRPQRLDAATPQDPGSAAPLLLEAVLDGGARSGDGRKRVGDGGLGSRGGIRPLWAMPWSNWKRTAWPTATWP